MRSPIIFALNLSYIIYTYTVYTAKFLARKKNNHEKLDKKNQEKNPQHRRNGNNDNWVCFLYYLRHCRCPLRLFQWLCIIFICIFYSQFFLLPSPRRTHYSHAQAQLKKSTKLRLHLILGASRYKFANTENKNKKQKNARRVRRTTE